MKDRKKRILLVEDEAIIAMTQKMSLQKWGYEVLTVHNGEKAIETALADETIDLILMDIDLGRGMDGTEAAERILQGRDIPVVFCSSHTEPEVVEKTEKITSYGYVVKSSSITVMDASLKMAFKLFESNRRRMAVEQEQLALAALVENTNDIAVVKDLNRRIISANRKFVQTTSRGHLSELIGRTDAEILGISEKEEPASSYMLDDLAALELGPGGSISREEDIPSPSGRTRTFLTRKFPIYADGLIRGLGVIATDITEQKEALAEIKVKNQLLSMIMETSPVGIATVDAEGNITYANTRAEEILGLRKDSITSRRYNSPEWRHSDIDGGPFPDEKQPFFLVKSTGTAVHDIRHGIVWPDGRSVMLSINASPMRDSDGEFAGMVATFEDISNSSAKPETAPGEKG